jgi:hypothetical protein
MSGAKTSFESSLAYRSNPADLLLSKNWYISRYIPGNFDNAAPKEQMPSG